MTEQDGRSTPDLKASVSASGRSRGRRPRMTRERLGLPDLMALKRVFSTGKDVLSAGAFVQIAATFPEVVKVEAICGKRGAALTPVINVIYRGMVDERWAGIVLDLENSHVVFGRDNGRVRFTFSAVDEADLTADRRNSPEFANVRIIPIWKRPEIEAA